MVDTGPGWGDGTLLWCEPTTAAKVGSTRALSNQPVLPSWAESEEVLVRLKGVSSQTSKMETDSFV